MGRIQEVIKWSSDQHIYLAPALNVSPVAHSDCSLSCHCQYTIHGQTPHIDIIKQDLSIFLDIFLHIFCLSHVILHSLGDSITAEISNFSFVVPSVAVYTESQSGSWHSCFMFGRSGVHNLAQILTILSEVLVVFLAPSEQIAW
jgi:hypothetical protein